MNNEFQWTNENVAEFSRHMAMKFNLPDFNGGWEGVKKEMEKFKQSKVENTYTYAKHPEEEKEYEILSYTFQKRVYNKNNFGEFCCGFDVPVQSLLLHPENMKTIHSVKRLSDGEVFTVGEKLKSGSVIKSITERVISGEKILYVDLGDFETNIQSLTKVKKDKEQAPTIKEYEILEFLHKCQIYILSTDGLYNRKDISFEARLNSIPSNSVITKVKRLSDEEVFTIGDKTNKGIITGFFIGWSGMEVHLGNDGCLLIGLQKLKAPLLTTEDGKNIYVGDLFYYIGDAMDICETRCLFKRDEDFTESKTFSTKEAADDYILMNKPILSLNDILNSWSDENNPNYYKNAPLFKRFIRAAKERL